VNQSYLRAGWSGAGWFHEHSYMCASWSGTSIEDYISSSVSGSADLGILGRKSDSRSGSKIRSSPVSRSCTWRGRGVYYC
jgi:hypothetical protein